MRSLHNRNVRGGACRVFGATALLLVVAAGTALAQGPGGGAPPIINPKGETDARTNREARLRSAELPAEAEEVNKQHLAAAIEQTKQDFKRIQVLRNELVDRLVSKQPLDYKQVGESADEIHKRAARLKTFMMKASVADEAKGEEKAEAHVPEYDEAGMKSALVKLCNTIYSFTGNPMFKNPAVVGADEPAKAGRELLAIIELSENVKRNAERLSKAGK
jgi:hypothetical protein